MTSQNKKSVTATVLIVDDAPGNLAVLSDMLSEACYRVLVATDGLSAIDQIEYLKPDIILLDVKMPGIDGFETCRRLKSNHLTRDIPIIFMTGLSELDALLKGFSEGAVDYIVKPIRPAEVLARVEAQLVHVRTLQKAEQTLNHIGFAALAFNKAGRITWLTASAVKVLYDSFADEATPKHELQNGEYLPTALLEQIKPITQTDIAPEQDICNEIQISDTFTGKIVACHQADEHMLLIQKSAQKWNPISLKNAFGLTAREAEILMWISRGKTNKEVGLILQTSPRTVNKHLEHIFEKLSVPTRTAAVAKVLNNNTN